ncbi:UNVERIFIED_CONTAM: hypothetical protein Slati_1475300 [Sesamum latifolium]|uniref:RNase H type-1 domain-containing protein n=1 Tax=Sesamum latifolium TaxID=2727402 RepID=A0AAW2X7K5_9LAMI
MPSIFVFAWRLLHNFIPVDERLKEKGIALASKCCCCENGESLNHRLLNSPAILEVWRYFGDLFNLPTPHTEFISTIYHCWKLSSPYVKRGHVRILIHLLILCCAWKLRNDAKFNDVPFTSSAIIRRVLTYLSRIYKANGFKTEHWLGNLLVAKQFGFNFLSPFSKSPILCRWVAPTVGKWKLNCDGASKGNPGPSGAGGLVRDDRGRLILAFYEFLGDQTNNYAELYGVARGLQLAWETCCHNVWVEMDAMAVLRIIESEKGDWRLQSLLTRIRMLKREMNLCFTHVYREANQPADFLANSACTMKESKFIASYVLFPNFYFNCIGRSSW